MSDVAPSDLPTSSTPYRSQTAHYPSWRALAWFAAFRLLLAAGLIVFFIPAPGAALWRSESPVPPTYTVLLVYAILVLLGLLSVYARWPRKEQQVQISIFVDIVTFTLLMLGSGGVSGGLGLLLAICVAAGSLLMGGRLSLLFASFATLGVIAQQVHTQLRLGGDALGFTQAGLLGITFFSVAILAHVLYRRIRETEQLAARREVDIADLSKLNEFIIQHMGTGVLAVDGERKLRLLNAAARILLEVPRATAGVSLGEIAPELATWLAENVANPSQRDTTVRIHDKDISLRLQLLGHHRKSGALLFLRDNSELIREAQEIKLASLGRLTASIAHNIRNPLSSVSHAGQLLAESPALSEEDLRLLDIVRRNSRRINEIIESILQLSRRDHPPPQELDLSTWLADFCTEFREAHDLTNAGLRLSNPSAVIPVTTNPRHLHQILTNLCDNVLKHAQSPEAPTGFEVRARTAQVPRKAVVEVSDEGPGIDPETARDIFTPFFTTSASGTGLGLYIARELCEANGINLEYIAREKRGSCFRLTLPFRA